MQARLLTLTQRPNGHWVSSWRTTTGKVSVRVIPSGTDLEKALPAIHAHLNNHTQRGK